MHVNDSFVKLSTAKVTHFFWNKEMFGGFSSAKSGFKCNTSNPQTHRVVLAKSTRWNRKHNTLSFLRSPERNSRRKKERSEGYQKEMDHTHFIAYIIIYNSSHKKKGINLLIKVRKKRMNRHMKWFIRMKDKCWRV